MLDFQNRGFKKQKLSCLQGIHLQYRDRDFPGILVVKTLPFNAEGKGLTPGEGIRVPHVTWCGQKIKIKFWCVKPPSLCTCDSA